MSDYNRLTPNDLANASFGLLGTWNGTSGTVTGKIVAIQALGDVLITSAVEDNSTGSLAGITLAAGTIIYGNFDEVVVASGQCRIYFGG